MAAWGSEVMGDEYSYVGAVVGATYPEMGKVLRKVMPKDISWFLATVHRGEKEKIWYTSLMRMDLEQS